jgi:hypothetical protein
MLSLISQFSMGSRLRGNDGLACCRCGTPATVLRNGGQNPKIAVYDTGTPTGI